MKSHFLRWRQLAGPLVVLFLILVVPLVVFGKIADEVQEGETLAFDRAILTGLHLYHTPLLDRFFVAVAIWGGAWGLLPLSVLVVVGLLAQKRRRAASFLFSSVGGAILLNLAAKQFFGRARPDLWTALTPLKDFSFPSGHAMLSTAVFSALIVICWPTNARWPMLVSGVLAIGLVALSRLYLGVHFPTDVAAGIVASVGWTGGLARLLSEKSDFSGWTKRWRRT